MERRPDVLVIGGGVVGLSTAVFCRRVELGDVLVIERGRLASGPSGAAAGALIPDAHALTDPPAFVALARASLGLHRHLDAEWEEALGLRTLDRVVLLPPDEVHHFSSQGTAEAVTAEQVHELEPDLALVKGALLFRDQAWVNPLRLAAALARHAGRIATGTEVLGLATKGGRVTAVETTNGVVHPGAVVFATGLAPEPWLQPTQRRVKGHLIAVGPGSFRLRSMVGEPNVGILPLPGGGLVAGGTHDEDDASPEVRPEIAAGIIRRLAELIPGAHSAQVTHTWCCFRPATADLQPVIDRMPGLNNAWVTFGHYGTGILLAPAVGAALASWIADGRRPREMKPFSLERFDIG